LKHRNLPKKPAKGGIPAEDKRTKEKINDSKN